MFPPGKTGKQSTVSCLWTTVNKSFSAPSFPLVYVLQRLLRLSPVSWLSLSPLDLASEVEERKFRARLLSRLHQFFLHLLLAFVVLEVIRSPVIWLIRNYVDYESSLFLYVSPTTVFYIVYGMTIIGLGLIFLEIIMFSKIPCLHVSEEILQKFNAEYLTGSSMFCLIRVQQEDPQKQFLRSYQLSLRARQEVEQSELLEQSALESSQFIRPVGMQSSLFLRQHSNKSSPHDSFSRMFSNYNCNRSPLSSQTSKSSSPSCLSAAADWDPVDRDEIENICGQSAFNKFIAFDEQIGKQKGILMDEESMNWSPQMQSLRDQNYQTSSLFRIPTPKKDKKQNSVEREELSRLRSDEKSYPMEDYSWMNLRVSDVVLHYLTQDVRIWIAGNIISPLLLRIQEVNSKLHEKMHQENIVGESPPEQLRMLANTFRFEIPELLQVIPFLDISMQQDYVVQRLKDLIKDGILGDFCWNGGTQYAGQAWQDFLPTDAALVMHCFITFFDVVLPPDPHAPNWRNFSHRYVLKSVSGWKSEDLNKPMIHQAVVNPPKYEILYNGQFLQVAEGKNNAFHTILLFIRLMDLREKSGQGYANLGSGRMVFDILRKNGL